MSNLRQLLRAGAERAMVAAYRVLDRIISYDADRACFISYPDLSDNSYAMFAYLTSDQAPPDAPKKVIWLVADVTVAKKRLAALTSAVGFGLKVCPMVKKNSLHGLFSFLRARTVFFTHGHYRFACVTRKSRRAVKLVNLWHGMPLKAIGLLDKQFQGPPVASDISFAVTDRYVEIIAAAFGIKPAQVKVGQLPRADFLHVSNTLTRAVRQKLIGARQRGLVVWMPTYRLSHEGDIRNDDTLDDRALLAQFHQDLHELEAAAAALSVAVVVKLHPMDFLNQAAFEHGKHVTVVRAADVQGVLQGLPLYTLLAMADVLVTDVSSVAIDYDAACNPVLITAWRDRSYVRDVCVAPKEVLARAHFLQSWDELPDICQPLLDSRDYRNTRTKSQMTYSSTVMQQILDRRRTEFAQNACGAARLKDRTSQR